MSLMRRDILGWSLYDFANTIYSMNIVSMYLKRYMVEDMNLDDRWFDIPFSFSMLLAALLLPALGAVSDHTAKKRIFLFLFTLSCCFAVGLMAIVPTSMIYLVILLFVIANFSYEAGSPFYNALLYTVADGRQARLVSGLGVSLGYVGAIVGIILVEPFVTGSILGYDLPFIEGYGKVGSFIPTAVLFLLFTLPIFFWVREKPIRQPKKIKLREAYREVWEGLRETKKYPGVLRFLIADYFFEDAIATVIINMSIYLSTVLAMAEAQIHTYMIVSTVSAVIGSVVIGKIAQYWRLKPMLQLIMVGWVVALVWFVLTDSMTTVWILGSLVGVLIGGLWTTSRPLLAELVPREELGRFFGLFALSGKAAAMVGPLIWTATVYYFSPERPLGRAVVETLSLDPNTQASLPYKSGLLSLAVMILIGLAVIHKLKEGKLS